MRNLRKPIATLLLLWYLPACTRYQALEVAPQEALADTDRVAVKVSQDGETRTIYLKEPWASADSIGGNGRKRIACPLVSV
jgi:hypothetical protein